jgi:hypothetical protein
MKRIYLSGPMTGILKFNHTAFHANAAFLRDMGYFVFSPAEMDIENGIDLSRALDEDNPLTEDEYHELLKNDYHALIDCDAIAFLPGWENSRGAKLESDFANVLKLERYRVDASKSYFEQEKIIGFTGFARSGKDTIAQQFVKNDGYERIGFADSLKSILYALNPRIELFNDDFIGHWHVKNIVDSRGWDEAKKEPEIRELLQRLGTEGGRIALGEDIWVKTLFNSPHGARIVISDVRFQNEADEIRRRGGTVVRIVRPGVGPVNDHASDKIDFEADIVIHNNKTPEDAYEAVKYFMAEPF